MFELTGHFSVGNMGIDLLHRIGYHHSINWIKILSH